MGKNISGSRATRDFPTMYIAGPVSKRLNKHLLNINPAVWGAQPTVYFKPSKQRR
jgi:hypothetical protein